MKQYLKKPNKQAPGKTARANLPANITPKAIRATVINLVFFGQKTDGAPCFGFNEKTRAGNQLRD
ncbi:MAG: hypothetical protein WBN22_06195 [Verrucomicrobiia bacterium]